MTHREAKMLRVGSLARVEGEGALLLRIRGTTVEEAQLAVYEPPRFFEAFLRGRSFTELPDITSRVCGICPVAYQLSACRAAEQVCGVEVDGQLAVLRRLLYCGEWIESQTLHIYLLHAPDFVGCGSAIALARSHRGEVERGLRLKQAGNAIVELLGGRAIHPVNVRVGGFHRTPGRSELRALAEPLRRAREDAVETVRWVSGFDFPDAGCDNEFFALAEPGTYAIESGTPTAMAAPSAAGVPADHGRALATRSFPVERFGDHVVETQVAHSTALHSSLDGRRHLTGSMARYAISGRWLSPLALEAAREAGLGDPRDGMVCRNPFRSIIVRAVEVLYAVDEALRLIEAYEPPPRAFADVPAVAGTGHGATEAPRGLLYHRYTLDSAGTVTDADIVPPTAQNQRAMEADLRHLVRDRLLDGVPSDAELTALCERVIRNHDPCISCSAHFLDLTVHHQDEPLEIDPER